MLKIKIIQIVRVHYNNKINKKTASAIKVKIKIERVASASKLREIRTK